MPLTPESEALLYDIAHNNMTNTTHDWSWYKRLAAIEAAARAPLVEALTEVMTGDCVKVGNGRCVRHFLPSEACDRYRAILADPRFVK